MNVREEKISFIIEILMKSFGVKVRNHKIVSKIEFDATVNRNIEFFKIN